MLEFILLFFPTFISLNILKNRENKDYKELLFLYPIYNIIINIPIFSILFLINRNEVFLFSQTVDSIGFCFKFLALASVVAVCIPYLKEFIKKNLVIEVEIRKGKNSNVKKK